MNQREAVVLKSTCLFPGSILVVLCFDISAFVLIEICSNAQMIDIFSFLLYTVCVRIAPQT